MMNTMTDYKIDMNQLGRVAVLYGGLSTERVLESGAAVLGALQSAGVDAVGIDVKKHLIDQLREARAHVVFIALHGAAGEDGRVQALLEFMNIPYTGSDVRASSIAMDKLRSKQIFKAAAIPTPAYCKLTVESD